MRALRKLWTLSQCRPLTTLPLGPDRIVPSDHQYVWEADKAVKIERDSIELLKDIEPISIPSVFHQTVEKHPNHEILVFNRGGNVKTWTNTQYYEDTVTAAKAMIRLGVEQHQGVCIIGFNAPQWMIAHFGAIFAGGLPAGVYSTSSPEICQHIASNSKARLFIVENQMQLEKILKIKKDLPHLSTIVQYMGKPQVEGVLSWDEFMNIGKDVPESFLKERLEQIAVNHAAVVIYTSGTTGKPKGALLSHDNVIAATKLCLQALEGFDKPFGSQVTFLPLNHIAGMIADIYRPILVNSTVHFAKPDAFQGSLIASLREAKPTVFFAVPRILEKMHEALLPKVPGTGPITEEMRIDLLTKIGLEACTRVGTGAAPPNMDTLNFFTNTLKLTPLELFGLTEGGVASFQIPSEVRLGSVGKTFIPMSLHNPDANGNGEIRFRGRTVFMGYLGEREKTEDTFENGWLKTGDLGKLDDDGFLYITGRIKELIITAGGENIPPVAIESSIREELPVLSNCMVVGDKKKYLSALITLRTEKDPKTEELLDELQPDVVEWCQSFGSQAKKLTDILNGPDQKVFQEIQKAIDRVNDKAMAKVQHIRRWCLLSNDFSMAGGEIGPTMKLVRPVVLEKYANIIESMYQD